MCVEELKEVDALWKHNIEDYEMEEVKSCSTTLKALYFPWDVTCLHQMCDGGTLRTQMGNGLWSLMKANPKHSQNIASLPKIYLLL